jgi:hypothetical protein
MGNESVDWIQLAWDMVPGVSYYGHGGAPWGSRKRTFLQKFCHMGWNTVFMEEQAASVS